MKHFLFAHKMYLKLQGQLSAAVSNHCSLHYPDLSPQVRLLGMRRKLPTSHTRFFPSGVSRVICALQTEWS